MDSDQISERFLSLLVRYYSEIYDDFSESDCKKVSVLRDEILDFENELNLSSVISKNEEIDDLNTGDIKYLLYSYIKAEAVRYVKDHNLPKERVERRSDLEEIRELYLQFFNDVLEIRNTISGDVLDLVDDPEIKKHIEEKKDRHHPTRSDARQVKIMRFKKTRELKSALSLFFKSAFSLSDEAENRCMFLKAINLFFIESLEQVSIINNEINVLNYMIKDLSGAAECRNGDLDSKVKGSPNQVPESRHPVLNVHHIAPNVRYLTSKENSNIAFNNVKSGEKIVINNREQFYTKVLGTSHALPTISIAEAADMELKEALEQEKSSIIARKKKEERDQILHDKEYSKEEEEDELKSREWDNWKDFNPKGHGNTIKNRG